MAGTAGAILDWRWGAHDGVLQIMGPPRSLAIASLTALLIAACSAPDPPDTVAAGELPQSAVDAFLVHTRQISAGALQCRAADIHALPRATGLINEDAIPDHALDTQRLSCRTRGRDATPAWFCSASACAFPALVSGPDGWQVVVLMGGNEIAVVEHYREQRFQVRQSVSTGVEVREYAWRDGALTRVSEHEESAVPRPETR
ncbi:hypothetical protein [Maricaulis sp. CAU 1757]